MELRFQPNFKISLVSEVDSVVSYIQLECAPYCLLWLLLIPIITNNEAHPRLIYAFNMLFTLVSGLMVRK